MKGVLAAEIAKIRDELGYAEPFALHARLVAYRGRKTDNDRDAHRVRGGPNGTLSLTAARENYRRLSACETRLVGKVRPPTDEEKPKP